MQADGCSCGGVKFPARRSPRPEVGGGSDELLDCHGGRYTLEGAWATLASTSPIIHDMTAGPRPANQYSNTLLPW